MGCCASTPAPPYDGQRNASSRNPIIAAQPRLQSQPNQTPGRPSTARSYNQPSNAGRSTTAVHESSSTNNTQERPNKTLKPLIWTSTDRVWTRHQIDVEREDFFFTRVTGRELVWQTIRTALEVIWHPDVSDPGSGIKTAQEILNAASVTLPHSTLDKGVYDSTGNFYGLPKEIVCDPTNLVVDSSDAKEGTESKDEGMDQSEEENESELQRRRAEKGKGPADHDNEEIKFKARRSDGGHHDLVIHAGKKDTVRLLRRQFSERGEIATPKTLQLWYMGRKLEDDKSPLDQGWTEGHYLQAFVRE